MLHKSRLSLGRNSLKKGSSEGLWAISYADFLMVLLSFFIIFFSTETKKSSIVSNIILDLKAIGQGSDVTPAISKGLGSQDKVLPSDDTLKDQAVNPGNKEVLNILFNAFDGEYVVNKDKNHKLLLKMPDNIFDPSDYAPPAKKLEKFIKLITPYQNIVYIKVIGHSDTISFSQKGSRVVNNNLTLSSIRASYTANYIKAFFPNLKVATEADDQNVRITRSLTFEISGIDEGVK